jgi:hypothetical protein
VLPSARAFVVIVSVAVAGCEPPSRAFALAAPEDDTTAPPWCSWAISAPEQLAGSVQLYEGPDVTCILPEYGDKFSVGFSHHERWWMQLDLARALIAPGEERSLDAPGMNLLALDCVSWNGWVRLDGDLPRWSVALDATCSDGADKHVRATFSGTRDP